MFESDQTEQATRAERRRERDSRHRRFVFIALTGGLVASLVVYGVVRGPGLWAAWNYEPREGDVVFQSLPRSPLVNTIEGCTGSPWSHCGLVAREDGEWVVYEALDGVERTPLSRFLGRSRDQRWAVYRLRESDRAAVPEMIRDARSRLGRPYDSRYRWDDEAIYCSELIGKAFEAATGRPLGRKVPLGSLDWRPYEQTIRELEGGPPPLGREMLVPRDLARAPELVFVTGHR